MHFEYQQDSKRHRFFFEKFFKSAKLNKCDIIGNAKAVLIIFFKARLTNVM